MNPREKPQKIPRAEKEEKEPRTERRESWSVLHARGLPGRCTGHGEVWSPLSGPFPRWFVRVLRSVCGVRAGYLRLLGRFRFRLVALATCAALGGVSEWGVPSACLFAFAWLVACCVVAPARFPPATREPRGSPLAPRPDPPSKF